MKQGEQSPSMLCSFCAVCGVLQVGNPFLIGYTTCNIHTNPMQQAQRHTLHWFTYREAKAKNLSNKLSCGGDFSHLHCQALTSVSSAPRWPSWLSPCQQIGANPASDHIFWTSQPGSGHPSAFCPHSSVCLLSSPGELILCPEGNEVGGAGQQGNQLRAHSRTGVYRWGWKSERQNGRKRERLCTCLSRIKEKKEELNRNKKETGFFFFFKMGRNKNCLASSDH